MRLLKSKLRKKYGETLYKMDNKYGDNKNTIRFIVMKSELDNMEVDLKKLIKENRLMSVSEWKSFYPNYTVKL